MKADELLKQYHQGNRDFTHANLQGQSFGGQNLAAANFSHADIRGTDFTNATLIDCNFSHAKAGLPNRQVIAIEAVSLLLLALSGSGSAIVGAIAISTLSDRFTSEFTSIPAIILWLSNAVLFANTLRQGFLLGALAAIVTISVAIPLAGILGPLLGIGEAVLAGTGPVGLAMACSLLGMLLSAIAVGTVRAAIDLKTQVRGIELVGGFVSLVAGIATWNVAAMVTATQDGAVPKSLDISGNGGGVERVAAIALAVAVVLLGRYVGLRAIAQDARFAFTRHLVIFLARIGGTRFLGADLSHASFWGATLKNTDLTGAAIVGTSWFPAQQLELAWVGTSYLQDAKVRQLLVTGEGQGENFDGLDLKGVNLSRANLEGASLIGTNLSHASLREANLAKAKLVQTQLARADLTWACLTGAFIQDWGIATTTRLDGIDCRYVYLRLPTADNPDPHRKPDNRQKEFAAGEFADFMAPLMQTLDLYHNQNVDPRAVAIAFKQLVLNHPEAKLEFLAMEKRGNNKFLLKVKTAATADRSELSRDYFTNYNLLRSLPRNDPRLLISQTDERSRSLERMCLGGSIGSSQNAIDARQAINQLSNFTEPKQQKLRELLLQLQQPIEQTTDLSPANEAKVWEQIQVIAEVGTYPPEWPKSQMKAAIRILRGIVVDLPSKSRLVAAGKQILPEISQIFEL